MLIYYYTTQNDHSSKYLAESTFQMPFWLVDETSKNSNTAFKTQTKQTYHTKMAF